MKKLLVFFAGMMLVGMTTVKAQGPTWDDNNVYRIGPVKLDNGTQATLKFNFNFTGAEFCNPLYVNVEGKDAFYFDKPILNPIMRGYSMVFDLYKGSAFCPLPADPSNSINFKVDGATKLFISGQNGYVGIGTDNPQRKLDVNGDIETKGLFVSHTATVDWSFASLIKVNRDLTKAFVIENTATGKTIFNIWGNGIVNAKKIYAEEFEITPNAMNISWYDHVFNQDYKLMSLSELEQFIKTNKHLPEILTEKEVKELHILPNMI